MDLVSVVELELVVLYTSLAGLMLLVGGTLADREHLRHGHFRRDLLRGIMAFGGGILLSAVTLVLIPYGIRGASPVEIPLAVGAGGMAFLLIDREIERRGGKAAFPLAVLMGDTPQAIALGAAFGTGDGVGPLLALLVGLRNISGGFNSYRELRETLASRRTIFLVLASLALIIPLAALFGLFVLAREARVVAWLFLFAAGGIIYLLFHDIAPMAHQEKHWAPTLGVLFGFLAGVLGDLLITPG